MMIRKKMLVNAGMFDENLRFWQDYELTIRLAQMTQFACVQENLVIYRVNLFDQHRLTNKYYEWWDAVHYIRNKHKNLYRGLSLYEIRHAKVEVYKDAKRRASACGLSKENRKLDIIIKLLLFPEILIDKAKSFI